MEKLLEQQGTQLVIWVPEELDQHTADEIREKADYLLKRENIQKLIFDFERTLFCDSSGIGMIMGRYKIMRALRGSVEVVHANENVHRILRISGVTKLISVNAGEA